MAVEYPWPSTSNDPLKVILPKNWYPFRPSSSFIPAPLASVTPCTVVEQPALRASTVVELFGGKVDSIELMEGNCCPSQTIVFCALQGSAMSAGVMMIRLDKNAPFVRELAGIGVLP